MKGFTRIWKKSTESKQYTHTVWIYDSGDTQGILLEEKSNPIWLLYKIHSRAEINGEIQETGVLQEGEIPFQYFSIESYPACFTQSSESLQLWIPGWQILTSFRASDSSSQMSPLPSSPQQQLPRPSHQRKPYLLGLRNQQAPSPLRHSRQNLPASPAPVRLHCSKPTNSQQNERNRRNTLPTQTSSPSSNPTSPLQQPKPNPKKPVSHHPRPSSKRQHVQNHQASQKSESSISDKSTSVSLDQTNSG